MVLFRSRKPLMTNNRLCAKDNCIVNVKRLSLVKGQLNIAKGEYSKDKSRNNLKYMLRG